MKKLELWDDYETIREIPDYGFAGREDLEEICLPVTVEKIGRYAFYNCRNLQKITFFSHIRDVGSGAFTGCHKVKLLDVTIMKDEESCLKDFLQELTEEIQVEYRGEDYALLMFPEYFEEGVENTPARILMTEIHGSGLKYRNCFYKKEFQFEEYDSRFPFAKAVEQPSFLLKMVIGRLRYPYRLQENGRKQYEDYLRSHFVEGGKELVCQRDAAALSWLVEHYGKKENELCRLLEETVKREAAECSSVLMEWRRRLFGKTAAFGVPEFDL